MKGQITAKETPRNIGAIPTYEPDFISFLDELRCIGFTAIQLTCDLEQEEWNGSEIIQKSDSDTLIHKIKAAKDWGFTVCLVIRLRLNQDRVINHHLWHGKIMPSDDQMSNWFANYEEIISKWAQLSEAYGVDQFVIGSELNELFDTKKRSGVSSLHKYELDLAKMKRESKRFLNAASDFSDVSLNLLKDSLTHSAIQKNKWAKQISYHGKENSLELINYRKTILKQKWLTIIQSVRSYYSGQIGLAANFDNYSKIDFWDKLDFVGINAYFPLRQKGNKCKDDKCLLKECTKNWVIHLQDIRRFLKKESIPNKKVVFTEIGYTGRESCTKQPWQGRGFSLLNKKIVDWSKQEVSRTERNIAIESLKAALDIERLKFGGLYYWKITTRPENLPYEPFALDISDELNSDFLQILRSL